VEPVTASPAPADSGQRTHGGGAPEAVRERGETAVAGDRHGDPGQIDRAWVDAVGQGDEDRYGERVGGVEQSGDPTGLPVGEVPLSDEIVGRGGARGGGT